MMSSHAIGQVTHALYPTSSLAIAARGRHNVGVEVFFLMMGLWLVVAVALGIRRPRGLGGAALRARLDAVYGEPHELIRVSPAGFPEADIAFYDRARRELEAKGYTFVADV